MFITFSQHCSEILQEVHNRSPCRTISTKLPFVHSGLLPEIIPHILTVLQQSCSATFCNLQREHASWSLLNNSLQVSSSFQRHLRWEETGLFQPLSHISTSPCNFTEKQPPEMHVNYWAVTRSHGAVSTEWAITWFLLRPLSFSGAGWKVKSNFKW